MRLGVSDQLIKIIHSYLNSREFRVRVENSLSTPRPILSGVPQGSLLGPKLFNLYINDIPKAVGVHFSDSDTLPDRQTCRGYRNDRNHTGRKCLIYELWCKEAEENSRNKGAENILWKGYATIGE
ncbi:RNA-directed DNA polymerase from mobile element jockey [Trichonephila clavipes]|nr:RNA-directed DNA polymerase from mobile element jockey [Trichonephila clavipes]